MGEPTTERRKEVKECNNTTYEERRERFDEWHKDNCVLKKDKNDD